MSALARMRRMVRKFGIDVQRYPRSDLLWPVVQSFRHHGVDLVLDVGANDGGYGGAIRALGYTGTIWSFEPLSVPFAKLTARTSRDGLWSCTRTAIGANSGSVTVNIAGNSGASSSILPMLETHRSASPGSAYVGTELVPLESLDNLFRIRSDTAARVFLKVDVQGYEADVLKGARWLFDSKLIIGLQMELSFQPLYHGGMTWEEGFEHASAFGMQLVSLVPGFSDPLGQMLQADAVFYRR